MLNLKEVNVTVHAMKRWGERGYHGNRGLLTELSRAQPLNKELLGSFLLDKDLRKYICSEYLFRRKDSEHNYFYTYWFIFVMENNSLITCIPRIEEDFR